MDHELTVLLVERNSDDIERLWDMLRSAPGGPFFVRCARTLADGLAQAEIYSPDVVLLDLVLPDAGGLEAFERMRARIPQAPVIIVSGQADEGQALRAMSEGAQDYVVKSKINATALARCIRYAIERHRLMARAAQEQPRHARTVAFLGAKGGVGTTTATLNVAWHLSQQRRDVVAVELRPSFGGFAPLLRQQPASGLAPLLELPAEAITRAEVAGRLLSAGSGLRLLYGPQRPLECREIDPDRAAAILRAAGESCQVLIVDLPAYPAPYHQAAAGLCDFLAVVLERDIAAVGCAAATLEQVRSWKPGPPMIGLVIVNRGAHDCPLPLNEISKQLGMDAIAVIPPAADACAMAQKAGVPLVGLQPDSIIAGSYQELAHKLAQAQPAAMQRA